MSFVDPLGLYDVVIFVNKGQPYIGHSAIVSEPLLLNDPLSRNVYYKTISESGTSIPQLDPFSQSLNKFLKYDSSVDSAYLIELEPNIFKDSDIFNVSSGKYNFFVTNCNSYAADVLNTSIQNYNRTTGMNLPRIDGFLQPNLIPQLQQKGYVKAIKVLK